MNGRPLQLFLFRDEVLLVLNAESRNNAWIATRFEKIENINALDPQELSSKLRGPASLNRRNSKQAPHTILVLERCDLAVRNLAFPKGEADETAAMLELELDRQLPLDISKVCFGFEKHSGEEKDHAQVYWLPLDRIEPRLETLKSAGLEIEEIRPALPSYCGLLPETPSDNAKFQIFLQPGQIELIHWSRPGIIGFSRIIKRQPHENGSSNDELDRSINAMMTNWDSESCVLVYSMDSDNEPISTQMAGTGARVDYHKVEFACAPGIADEVAAEFLPLLAVLDKTRAEPNQDNSSCKTLNMLPHSIEAQRQRIQLRKATIQLSVLSALVVVLVIANVLLYFNRLQTQIDTNMAEIKALTPEARQVEAMEERIASIQRQINYVITPIDALGAVNQILADQASRLNGLYLDHFDYSETGVILLEGHSTNDITPWSFAEALDKSGQFKIVQKPRIQMRLYGETRAIRFQLSCQAVKPASAKDSIIQ